MQFGLCNYTHNNHIITKWFNYTFHKIYIYHYDHYIYDVKLFSQFGKKKKKKENLTV